MPLDVVLPEKIKITFSPRLAICASTCAVAPLPMPTMAITAPTPMMIPSAVSTERILFRRNARYATLNVGAIRTVQGWSVGVLFGAATDLKRAAGELKEAVMNQ